jgi:hypothetical protein
MPTTVGDVVSQYLIEQDNNSQHGRPRLINIAISGLKELHFDVTGAPVFTQLTLDSNKTAAVPTGLINVIGMFMNSVNYGLLEIVESKQLPPNLINSQGSTVIADKSTFGNDPSFGFGGGMGGSNVGSDFQGGEFRGGVYSGVGSNPYKYNWNRSTNRFEFSSNVTNPILEYLGQLGTTDGKHCVPEFAVDALIQWIRYVDTRNKGISPSEKRYNQQSWVNAKNLVLRRMANITPAGLREGFRKNYSLTVK